MKGHLEPGQVDRVRSLGLMCGRPCPHQAQRRGFTICDIDPEYPVRLRARRDGLVLRAAQCLAGAR